jgi:hypothetical protein
MERGAGEKVDLWLAFRSTKNSDCLHLFQSTISTSSSEETPQMGKIHFMGFSEEER